VVILGKFSPKVSIKRGGRGASLNCHKVELRLVEILLGRRLRLLLVCLMNVAERKVFHDLGERGKKNCIPQGDKNVEQEGTLREEKYQQFLPTRERRKKKNSTTIDRSKRKKGTIQWE